MKNLTWLSLAAALFIIAAFLMPSCGDPHDDDDDYGAGAPPRMTLLPTGCFGMGDAFSEGSTDERPLHLACVSSFHMDTWEVTNSEYRKCEQDGACAPVLYTSSSTRPTYHDDGAYDNYPVLYVGYDEAVDYCAWAGKRLPTEAEWEYAARGGQDLKRFFWGNTIDPAYVNYMDSGDQWDNDTSPVRSFKPNGFGLYDMAGNVEEWVGDFYSATYYQYCVDNNIVMDPPGPASGSWSLRGGAWMDGPTNLRVSRREYVNTPYFYSSFHGFRCAKDK